MSREPNARVMPEIPRRLDLVDHGLRKVFRDLVSGLAPWPLYLWGPVGSGKSMAGLCLVDHTPDALYVTVERLADLLVANDEGYWVRLHEARLVVLDELGARQRDTDLHYTAIKKLADLRERQNRVAVYISNLSIKGLADLYDDRIASRLGCGVIYELDDVDRRREP